MSGQVIAKERASALAIFGVRPEEQKLITPALALAFLAVGANQVAQIIPDSLFVSMFSLGALSRMMMIAAVVKVVVALAYASIASRFGGHRLDLALLVGNAIVMAASAIASRSSSATVVYAIYLAQLPLPPLLPLVAFNVVLGCFHPRQAKRLLPLVAAAATLGTMAAGASARGFATTIGAGPLLFFGAALSLAAAPLPKLLAARAREAGVGDDAKPATTQSPLASIVEATRDLREVRVARVVVAIAIVTAASVAFVDFALKAALKAHYDRDGMAAFIGSFTIVANALVLFAQLFVASRFIGRFGVRASLASFPLALVVVGPVLAIAPSVAAAVASKLADFVFRYALGQSTADLILTPAPSPVRTRVKILVKGAAGPAGAFFAGAILAAFGEHGPPDFALGALVAIAGVLGLVVTRGARAAYASALSSALGEGRVNLDVSPASAAILRDELIHLLTGAVARRDAKAATRVLVTMSDRLFSLDDVAVALTPADDSEDARAIARTAATIATHLARPDEGPRLLALVPPTDDPLVERAILAAARDRDAPIPKARLDRAVAATERADDEASAELWADAQLLLVQHDRAAALKRLRRAAASSEPHRRAAALRAIGFAGDRSDTREVLRAMASDDARVFAAGANAAVRLDAQGAIDMLVARLSTGPNVRASARALALAGPRAVSALVAALPTTRGERSALPTAVASDTSITGTIRAARVLARLGPEGCARALERFGDLGYRGRNAIARAFATITRDATIASVVDPDAVTRAMELTVGYAETLLAAVPSTRDATLLRSELLHRIGETGARVLDLASVLGDRALIAKARSALGGDARHREGGLELLENVLPRAIAARTAALVDRATAKVAADVDPSSTDVHFDGWLDKCAKFDAGALAETDPMLSVLEKVLVLRDSSLFDGLSGEELYPVAEIADSVEATSGAFVVKEGDPGDALFVVASGRFSIKKGAAVLREIEHGAVFGELALLDGAPRSASVIAASDGRLLRIPRAEFEALLDESPELARGVIRTLVSHLRGG